MFVDFGPLAARMVRDSLSVRNVLQWPEAFTIRAPVDIYETLRRFGRLKFGSGLPQI